MKLNRSAVPILGAAVPLISGLASISQGIVRSRNDSGADANSGNGSRGTLRPASAGSSLGQSQSRTAGNADQLRLELQSLRAEKAALEDRLAVEAQSIERKALQKVEVGEQLQPELQSTSVDVYDGLGPLQSSPADISISSSSSSDSSFRPPAGYPFLVREISSSSSRTSGDSTSPESVSNSSAYADTPEQPSGAGKPPGRPEVRMITLPDPAYQPAPAVPPVRGAESRMDPRPVATVSSAPNLQVTTQSAFLKSFLPTFSISAVRYRWGVL